MGRKSNIIPKFFFASTNPKQAVVLSLSDEQGLENGLYSYMKSTNIQHVLVFPVVSKDALRIYVGRTGCSEVMSDNAPQRE